MTSSTSKNTTITMITANMPKDFRGMTELKMFGIMVDAVVSEVIVDEWSILLKA